MIPGKLEEILANVLEMLPVLQYVVNVIIVRFAILIWKYN